MIKSKRKLSTAAGIFYILGTVFGVLSLAVSGSIGGNANLLTAVSENENGILFRGIFIMLMGISLSFVPIVLYPVLRKSHKLLAVSYIIYRSGLETILYFFSVILMFMLVPLSRIADGLTAGNDDVLQSVSVILFNADAISFITTIVFSIGAFMLYFMLYRARLVPRWLSGWGLLAICLYGINGTLAVFGVYSAIEALEVALYMPLALQEMVLAIWMIVKGFSFRSEEER